MHSISDWLDRFCSKHYRWGIPNLMLYIIIGNVAVYLLDMFSMGSFRFSDLLTFVPYYIFHGQIWRLVTFIFVPGGGSILAVALTLYLYYFIGTSLEREWGTAKFTIFYGMGILMNIVAGIILALVFGIGYPFPVVSIQYLNMSLFLAFAALYPDMRLLLFFIIPVKMKWLAWLDVALFAWSILSAALAGAWVWVFVPLVSLLNFFLFFSGDFMRIFGRIRHQTSRQTVNFKKAARDAKKEKGYLHKCAVCGVTDADDPNMEFRYCSRCNGYYCYCMDHINNHVHIQ